MIEDQPPPRGGEGDIALLVMRDIIDRRELGISRYGTPLQAHNGRDALIDAYQECIDLTLYLRQLMQERGTPRQDAPPS